MSLPEYLRQQAAACLRLSRSTFDLSTAERLRHLAAELGTKADQVENEEDLEPHMTGGRSLSHSGPNGSNGHT